MSVFFGNFDVDRYMGNNVKWIVYLDRHEEDEDRRLVEINYYLGRHEHQRFEFRYGVDEDEVKKVREIVKKMTTTMVSIYHLDWLKRVMSDKKPLMCHMIDVNDKKAFLYMLKLSPWSVLGSLDGVHSVLGYALKHKLRWYYEKMFKYLLRESKYDYGLVLDRILSVTSTKDAIMKELIYTKRWKDMRYLLKMRHKQMKNRNRRRCQHSKNDDVMTGMYCVEMYIEMYMKANDAKVASKLVDLMGVIREEMIMIRMVNRGIMEGWDESVKKLLVKSRKLGWSLQNAVEGEGENETLMLAISYKRSAMMSYLFEFGFDSSSGGEVETPLMYAIDISDGSDAAYEVIEMLLKWKCDVNYVCREGSRLYGTGEESMKTALEIATIKGDMKIIRMLLRNGAYDEREDRLVRMYARCQHHGDGNVEKFRDMIRVSKKVKMMECAGYVEGRREEGGKEEEGIMGEFMCKVDHSPYMIEMVLGML
jgi:hypothetical protein